MLLDFGIYISPRRYYGDPQNGIIGARNITERQRGHGPLSTGLLRGKSAFGLTHIAVPPLYRKWMYSTCGMNGEKLHLDISWSRAHFVSYDANKYMSVIWALDLTRGKTQSATLRCTEMPGGVHRPKHGMIAYMDYLLFASITPH